MHTKYQAVLMSTDINMPILKAGSAITAAVVAKADVADQVAQAATATSNYETWIAINSIPWGTIAAIAAGFYSFLLITEWWWKKLWRPFFESRKWIKPKRHRIITVEEYDADTDKAPL